MEENEQVQSGNVTEVAKRLKGVALSSDIPIDMDVAASSVQKALIGQVVDSKMMEAWRLGEVMRETFQRPKVELGHDSVLVNEGKIAEVYASKNADFTESPLVFKVGSHLF